MFLDQKNKVKEAVTLALLIINGGESMVSTLQSELFDNVQKEQFRINGI